MHQTLQTLSITLKSRDLVTCGFQKKKNSDTPTKTRWSRAQSPYSRVLATNPLPL